MSSSSLRLCLPLSLLLGILPAFAQSSDAPIPVDLPSSFSVRYFRSQPTQCYQVLRPASGGITATITGPGRWRVCIGEQKCPTDCDRSSQETATAQARSRGEYYYVRVVTESPGTAATLSIQATHAEADVAGTWTVVFKERTSTTLTLEQSGQEVTGNLVTTDGSSGRVTGRIAGSTLTLSRDTGLKTTQHYQVTIQGDSFTGTYRNQGKIRDSGTFTGSRSVDVKGTWTVVFRGQTSTTLALEQSGQQVSGTLTTMDGTPGRVTGKLEGSTLTLSRDTGLKTIQHYQVQVQGDSFSGSFHNEGRISDSGTFTGSRSRRGGVPVDRDLRPRRTRAATVDGTWTVVFRGQTTTTLTLEQSGQTVTGELVTTDGTPGRVTGTLVGSTLMLSRDTGLKTVQHYQATIQGDAFSGTFRNEGRIADNGTFTGSRSLNIAGTWTVVFKGQVSTTLTLEQSGSTVKGNLVTMDGTPGTVTGRLSGSMLLLSRNTGLDTIQHFQVTVEGDSFSGTFRNEGRFSDNGSFTGLRR